MTIKAEINDTGIVRNTMRLDFHSLKKSNTTKVTKIRAYQIDELRLLIDEITNSSEPITSEICTSEGNSFCMSLIFARTALATSTVLAPDCFCINRAIPRPLWLKADALVSLKVSLMVATSLRRTTFPLNALITVFSSSCTLSYLLGILTEKS